MDVHLKIIFDILAFFDQNKVIINEDAGTLLNVLFMLQA